MNLYDDQIIEQIKIIVFSELAPAIKRNLISRCEGEQYIDNLLKLKEDMTKLNKYVIFIGGSDKLDERKKLESCLWGELTTPKNRDREEKIKQYLQSTYNFDGYDIYSRQSHTTEDYIYNCICNYLNKSELIDLLNKFCTTNSAKYLLDNMGSLDGVYRWTGWNLSWTVHR